MFVEVGILFFMVLVFEVNSLIIVISILFFFVYEVMVMWDVFYVVIKCYVGLIE